MNEAGLSGSPDVIEVRDQADAALGYRGSLSVAVNGIEVDARMAGAPGLEWG